MTARSGPGSRGVEVPCPAKEAHGQIWQSRSRVALELLFEMPERWAGKEISKTRKAGARGTHVGSGQSANGMQRHQLQRSPRDQSEDWGQGQGLSPGTLTSRGRRTKETSQGVTCEEGGRRR